MCVFRFETFRRFRFAVERLEHAIVLWKLLVCELSCSPSTTSGRFSLLGCLSNRRCSRRQDEGFLLSISNVFPSVRPLQFISCFAFYECVLIERQGLWFIDIRIILIIFRGISRDRLKNVESLKMVGFVQRLCNSESSRVRCWLITI